MLISVAPDSGNIELLDCSRPHDVRLKIRPDNAAAYRQWFYFRCVGVNATPIRLRILNAGTCTYPKGWEGYAATASYDGVVWFRVPTRYADGELWIEHTPERNVVDYAYFAPYPHERRMARLDWLEALPGELGSRRIETLGRTPDGHLMQVLVFGTGPVPIWIVARQHPGEVMAEWFAEGLVDRLVASGGQNGEDPVVRRILERATVRIVPCMNPDGGRRGNHRTNARGVDLNTTWHAPDRKDGPEVGLVRDRMDEVGVALALDVHGDEEIPYNFASGGDGTPSWDPERAELKRRFVEAWVRANPEFQTVHGYPARAPGEADLTECSQQLAERFRCLALTVEQPFKDNQGQPDAALGWSSVRSKRLGASVLDPIDAILADLL